MLLQPVEHPKVKEMVDKLKPGYSPPTKNQIAEMLLPTIFDNEKSKCANLLQNKTVCLLLDGWSNVHK